MYISGQDLGQAADFSALVVTEQIPAPVPAVRRKFRYLVRFIKIWDLGTDYTVIARETSEIFLRPPLTYTRLAVDFTGVGRPVFDQLRAAKVKAHMEPILITGGAKVSRDEKDRSLHVPKVTLVSNLVALMQSELVIVSPKVQHADRLRKELGDFTAKVSRKSNSEQFGTWRDGQHDDLVLSLALAVWLGEFMGAGSPKDISVPDSREASAVGAAPDGVFL